MFRRPTKKQLLIRRIALYSVMTLSVIVIVTGTILFILGYRLDSNNGQLSQGSLVQFDSTPSGATILVDGIATGDRTAAKKTMVAGEHAFSITRDGYLPWNKSLTLKAGTLTWLDYVRLVPADLKSETVATYDAVYDEKASPDNKKLLVQPVAGEPVFELVDISNQEVVTSTVRLPTSVFSSGSKHAFVIKSWDSGGRFVLLHHTYDKKTEWIVLDTQQVSRSTNVSRLLSLTLSDVRFAGTSGNILFGLADGVVRKLDLSNETISRALISNVKSFSLFETNVVSYVGTNDDGTEQVAGVYRDGDESAHVLRSIDDMETPLRIDATRYYSENYVAISEGLKVTVFEGRYPASSQADTSSLLQVAEFTVAANVSQLTFSPSGDFLVARSGLEFSSYEVEHDRLTRATIETSGGKAYTLRWLDDAYLWAVYDGHLSMREFDGTNAHVIMAMEPGFDATLSQNGRYMYGMTKSADGKQYQLQRVTMILN